MIRRVDLVRFLPGIFEQKSPRNSRKFYREKARFSLQFQGFCGIIRGMDKSFLEGLPAPVIEYISSLKKLAENQTELLEKQQEQLGKQDELLEKQQLQIDRLTEMLRLAQKARFGPSSEKSKYILGGDSEQTSLFNEAEAYAQEDEPEPVIVEKHTRKPKRTKEELAKALPVREVIITLAEEERVCDICESTDLKVIGKELVRRELCIIPAQAFVTATYAETYACVECEKETDEANIIKPEVPEPVVKRGLASPSSVAHVMYQKYVNAMPLYRQAKDWEQFGVSISRATLANWIIYTSLHWLLPLWKALKTVLLPSPVIHADETVIQVLEEDGKTPQSESRMWVYCTGNVKDPPPIILFEYQPSRAGENPKEFLEGARDFYLQTDGYIGYSKVENAIHCGCWAHVRRKFNDALPKNAPKNNKAFIALNYCRKLFALEDKWAVLPPDERQKKRGTQSKPILDEFFNWVETVNPLAGSKLAEAITYARNQKEPLSAFLLDGRIEISNNRCENSIRPFAVGRRNWLFAKTVDGAQASAVAYSIIETAKANGLNPYQYLFYLFTELPTVLTKEPNADLSRFFPWEPQIEEKCRLANGEGGQLALLK